jgi:hypothetical protein
LDFGLNHATLNALYYTSINQQAGKERGELKMAIKKYPANLTS